MKTLSSIITNVTVYPDRAQVTRKAKEKVTKGSTELIFDFLPATIDEQSIQVKGSPGFSMKEIQFKEINYDDFPEEKYALLIKEREELDSELIKIQQEKIRYDNELAFLQGIQAKLTSPAEESSELDFNVKNWEGMMTMYRTKAQELHTLLFENNSKKRALDNKKNKLDADLLILFGGNEEDPKTKSLKRKKQVSVWIESETDQEIEIALLYVVKNVQWIPSYDIKVDTTVKKIRLLYYAQITQHTQEDWKDATIRVSTAKPALNKQLPELSYWYLMIHDTNESYKNQPMKASMSMDKMMEESESGLAGSGRGATILTSKIQSGATSVFFELPGKYSILSGDKKHKAAIDDCELKVDFHYSAVTGADDHYAYLQAEIQNTTQYPLLMGAANIYIDGNFMRTTSLAQTQPGETLSLSLGADEAVIVKNPALVKEEKKEGLFNKKRKINCSKEIYIKNTKQTEFLFIIKDYFPWSPNKEVVVELLQPVIRSNDDSIKKDDLNLIEWKFVLKPGEEKKIPLHFTIEHPLQFEVEL